MELRMYGLVPYNISPIQQGIQAAHSFIEYGLKYFTSQEYQEWALKNKTFIILNGGTTNNNPNNLGTLNNHAYFLESLGIKIARFYEPDLGDQLTAFCFIINEKVFNKKLYPDYTCSLDNKVWSDELEDWINEDTYQVWRSNFNEDDETTTKIIKLRKFLKPLKLA
jgi:hypothetical protein